MVFKTDTDALHSILVSEVPLKLYYSRKKATCMLGFTMSVNKSFPDNFLKVLCEVGLNQKITFLDAYYFL